MIIRPATQQDLTGIRDIYRDAILHSTAVYEYEPFDAAYIESWFNQKKQENFPVIVATDENRILGFCTYGEFRLRAAYKPCKEHSVYVHPDHRGVGLGKILLQKIMDEARSAGVHTLIGGVDADNAISIELHRKFGFTQVGHLREVAFKFDKWLDLVLLQVML